MCIGQKCPVKENCLRYTGTVYGRQDFFGSLPFNFEKNLCDFFIDERPTSEQISELAYLYWQKSGTPTGSDNEFWLKAENDLIERKRNS